MNNFYWYSIVLMIGFILGVCMIEFVDKPVQQQTTYTQEQVDKLVDIAIDELVRCEEDLYSVGEDLIYCQSVCVKCVLKLVQTKMKGIGSGLSRYFKFSLTK